MKIVQKFTIPFAPEFELVVPEGAKVVDVGMQDTDMCMWAIVDTDAEPVRQRFFLVTTGSPIPTDGKGVQYLGTIHEKTRLTNFVAHLFKSSVLIT